MKFITASTIIYCPFLESITTVKMTTRSFTKVEKMDATVTLCGVNEGFRVPSKASREFIDALRVGHAV